MGRWQADSVLLSKTGTPFNLITGSNAPGFGYIDGISGDPSNLVDPAIPGRTISHPDLSRNQLPRAAFSFIRPSEDRGNLGRHTFRRTTIRKPIRTSG